MPASRLGSALAAPVVGLLMLSVGWRAAFVVTGIAGVMWVIAWRLLMTDHPRGAAADLVEADRATVAPPGALGPVEPLRTYLLQPAVLALGLGLFAMNYPFYLLLSWLPTYLTHTLHLPVKTMVFVAAIPWACGIIGYVGVGVIGDLLYKRLPDQLLARKITTTVPLALSVVALLALCVAGGAVAAVLLICLIVILMTGAAQSCWATVHELVPQSRVGAVSGFVHLLSNISGIIGPAVTGFAVQYSGGFDSAFVLSAAIACVSAIAMAAFVKRRDVAVQDLAFTGRGAN